MALTGRRPRRSRSEKINAAPVTTRSCSSKQSGKATQAGIEVSFEGEGARQATTRLVLVAVGRSRTQEDQCREGRCRGHRPWLHRCRQADAPNVPHIFAIGDIVGQLMLALRRHEAHVAAEAAHGEAAFFDARQIPSVAYRLEGPGPARPRSNARPRHQDQQGSVSRGLAAIATDATRASPSCSSTRRPTASSAAASSAPMPAT